MTDWTQFSDQPEKFLRIFAQSARQHGPIPPREQALVDQHAMDVRADLARIGRPIDREILGLYILGLVQVGELTGHKPGQSKHLHPMTEWFGHRAMAVVQVAAECGIDPLGGDTR